MAQPLKKLGMGHIGNRVRTAVERLSGNTSATAFDLLTISMAVTAADTFFNRSTFSDNNWARDFELSLPVVKRDKWVGVSELLSQTLNFLTGDHWKFNFLPGGPQRPDTSKSRLKKRISLDGADTITLYSGGLDSWLGV